jgi:hypothetical protein
MAGNSAPNYRCVRHEGPLKIALQSGVGSLKVLR